MMNTARARVYVLSCVGVGAALGCASKSSTPSVSTEPTVTTSLTYYQDVQPIIESKCVQCHSPGNIGPFAFQTPEDVISRKSLVAAAVASKRMPPWPASDSCTSYERDRSLSPTELDTLLSWIDGGAPVGDAASQVTAPPAPALSRVDLTLQMPEPFTPDASPDEYRCFLIPWTPSAAKYVTGLGVHPGDRQIVHHTIAFVSTPSQVAEYQALDNADPGPGWTCFGGPGISTQAQWLGAWAPGALGADFPPGTGVLVQPGSMIVLQVHYNTANGSPAPDQTSVDIELADSVDKPAAVVPFTNPAWVKQKTMTIPAGAPDTSYSFAVDVTSVLATLSSNVLTNNLPVNIYSTALHMHTRGTSIKTSILHADASSECMLDIPAWNFSWQGQYAFTAPKRMSPGDKLSLECHWDNTAAHQPYVNGVQVAPQTLNWGETTEDEMCLEILYLTQ